MAVPQPVTHVIFDLDGTLLETEHVFTHILQSIVERYGKMMTWKLRARTMGRPPKEAAAVIIKELQLPLTVDEFVAAQLEFYPLAEEAFLKAKLKPGAERLIRHLYQHGVPMAIATSSRRATYDLKISSHKELFGLIHHVVNGPDEPEVTSGKPHPMIFQLCARRFVENPYPEKVLVFEDSPSGVQSASTAGMQVILVPDPRLDPSLRGNASLVLTSLEDFKPEMFGLPPFPESIRYNAIAI